MCARSQIGISQKALPPARRRIIRAAAPGTPTSPDSGFTLTELMVVVVIVGVLSAVATPFFGKDRKAREGHEFSGILARDLARARQQAISERLPVRAYLWSDRVEFRIARQGVKAGDPPFPITPTDAIQRMVMAKGGVEIITVKPTATSPPTPTPLPKPGPPGLHAEIEFDIFGQAQYVGQGAMSQGFIYIQNTQLPMSHQDRQQRIDVTPLTGHVDYRDRWN